MKSSPNVICSIGQTPLVELSRVLTPRDYHVYAKIEGANPGGSIKDRSAMAMIQDGLRSGRINQGTTIIESSSGNMAIGLAQACRYFGLPVICVIDRKTTSTNRAILRAYGARLECVEAPDPLTGEYLPARLLRVRELLEDVPNSHWPNQYENRSAVQAMSEVAREILSQAGQPVDWVLCATSTCSTLRGCSEYLRLHSPRTRLVAVDAVGSVIFGQKPRPRLLPGHGAALVPPMFGEDLASQVVHVTDTECVSGCLTLLSQEAIFAGASSGAVLAGLGHLHESITPGSVVVLIFADRGERYLDTVFSPEWATAHLNLSSGAQVPMIEARISEVCLD